MRVWMKLELRLLSFPGGEIKQASEQAGERRSMLGVSETGEKWGGGERERGAEKK